MSNTRRWYIYGVSAITLNAVTWAIIELIRHLLISARIDASTVAFQISVVIIVLPIFLGHWLWARRLAAQDNEEQGSTVRTLYLYGMQALFLSPIIFNLFYLLARLFGRPESSYSLLQSLGDVVIFRLVALIILSILWYYHQYVLNQDRQMMPLVGAAATVRRLYVLAFSATGLSLTLLAVIHLLRWLLVQGGTEVIGPIVGMNVVVSSEVARLLVGVPLWIFFWRWSQQLRESGEKEEWLSVLFPFYLYTAIFIGALSVVSNLTVLIADILRNILSLPLEGDWRRPVPIVIGMAIVWGYHTYVLIQQSSENHDPSKQGDVRHLYYYLIAGVGLSALLVGVSGNISVIIRSLAESFGNGLRAEFAQYTAAIIAGLPVWLYPWYSIQNEVNSEEVEVADEARQSYPRTVYLYFFLFLAVMTVLSSVVYIVFRLISMLLGEDAPTLAELGQAISFAIIAGMLWYYHIQILRGDNQKMEAKQLAQASAFKVAIVDVLSQPFMQMLVANLKRIIPNIELDVLTTWSEEQAPDLTTANLIVTPWQAVTPTNPPLLSQAISDSPARKLVIPLAKENWLWVGNEFKETEEYVQQAVHTIQQMAQGQRIQPKRGFTLSSVGNFIVGAILVIALLALPLFSYFIF